MELRIDHVAVDRGRSLARAIADPIEAFISMHSTVSVERAILRLLGVDGVGADEVPVPNLVVDAFDERALAGGIARWIGRAVAETGDAPENVAYRMASGELAAPSLAGVPEEAARAALRPHVERGLARVAARRAERERLLQALPQSPPPLLYVIVASGNIYEDRAAAVAAAEAGAQIVAVIRSTAQSLLDFVPYGATTEGFGGTYATQENFRIMREALDEVSERLGRYVMLTNYASGLCMPEIAAMAALERLDMLLNDSMYGILFRDINMKRTFVDQHFCRMLNARAGIIINTGEDNYLTTADAVEQASHGARLPVHQRSASRIARGCPTRRWVWATRTRSTRASKTASCSQLAQAQLARQIFPRRAPQVHAADQAHDRRHLQGPPDRRDVQPRLGHDAPDDPSVRHADRGDPHPVPRRPRARARERALRHGNGPPSRRRDPLQARRHRRAARADRAPGRGAPLERVAEQGLMAAIEARAFADVSRSPDGGRGFDGVFERAPDYWNPFEDALLAPAGHRKKAAR